MAHSKKSKQKELVDENVHYIYSVFCGKGCNPNGDPNSGEPRSEIDGLGSISFESERRKIRDKIEIDLKQPIHLKRDIPLTSSYKNYKKELDKIHGKTEKDIKNDEKNAKNNPFVYSVEEYQNYLKENFLDVRFFGNPPGPKGLNKVDLGGAIFMEDLESNKPVQINRNGITKSYNFDATENNKNDSSTMGNRAVLGNDTLYSGFVGVSKTAAERNGLTKDDLKTFEELLSNYNPMESTVRHKYNNRPKSLIKFKPSRKLPSDIGDIKREFFDFLDYNKNGIYYTEKELKRFLKHLEDDTGWKGEIVFISNKSEGTTKSAYLKEEEEEENQSINIESAK